MSKKPSIPKERLTNRSGQIQWHFFPEFLNVFKKMVNESGNYEKRCDIAEKALNHHTFPRVLFEIYSEGEILQRLTGHKIQKWKGKHTIVDEPPVQNSPQLSTEAEDNWEKYEGEAKKLDGKTDEPYTVNLKKHVKKLANMLKREKSNNECLSMINVDLEKRILELESKLSEGTVETTKEDEFVPLKKCKME